MGTEVLRPHDFWNEGFRLPPRAAFHHRRSYYPHNSRPSRKPLLHPRSDQRRKSPSPSPSPSLSPSPASSPAHSSPPSPTPKPAPPIGMPRRVASAVELHAHMQPESSGRRGQSLDTIDATRMKRDMRKKCMDNGDVYAGSAFFSSPSPSSLPQPSFFNENNAKNIVSISKIISTAMKNDSASRDLRRMLRLE